MESELLRWALTFATVAIFFLLGHRRSHVRLQRAWWPKPHRKISANKLEKDRTRSKQQKEENHDKENDEFDREELQALKQLYYQLHHLEKFPEVLPGAKRLLLLLLKEANSAGKALSESESILSVATFSRLGLQNFQRKRDHNIGKRWEQYNLRRREGGRREMFEDKEEAIWWLKQIAPVKYVDGAWLGHIGKVTTPFLLQKTTKGAWQILSEELGDGDLEKNHVYIYHKLLKSLAPELPMADELDFGHERHRLDQLSVWKAAIVQLIISLFPNDFLPEILGFNLHFEGISMETLMGGKELREVGINPYYFILHVSIDNSHSGHSAIAVEIICEYMEYIRSMEGDEGVQRAWEKVQAGYLLSAGLPGTASCPSRKVSMGESRPSLSPIEMDVMEIFIAKAQFVHGIHCGSRVKIGGRSIVDWLDPDALESEHWQRGLLDALSYSKYWIRRGDSGNSRFMRELQWNGRMFGSFTQSEYDILRRWIDGLTCIANTLDSSCTKHNTSDDDSRSNHTALGLSIDINSFESLNSLYPSITPFPFHRLPTLDLSGSPDFESFLPLWLSHPCLLQAFVAVPFQTKNEFVCTIVRILRAQGGFDIEQECVGGMCEVRRPNSLGLVGIGINVMEQHGLPLAPTSSLKLVLQIWPSEFSVYMLQISMRPLEYKGFLVGMATAFAKMHVILARSRSSLFSKVDQDILSMIAQRELEGLAICWQKLELDEKEYASCCKGYLTACFEIKKCFQS